MTQNQKEAVRILTELKENNWDESLISALDLAINSIESNPIPCKPGDHIWVLFRDRYTECEVTSVIMSKFLDANINMWVIEEERPIQGSSSEFGYNLFYTEEEVRAAFEAREAKNLETQYKIFPWLEVL